MRHFPSKIYKKNAFNHIYLQLIIYVIIQWLYATVFLFCPNQVNISDFSKREALFPKRASQMSCVSERDTQRYAEKNYDFKPH